MNEEMVNLGIEKIGEENKEVVLVGSGREFWVNFNFVFSWEY